MKHLYIEQDERLSQAGIELWGESHKLLLPLFRVFAKEGYSFREIAHIMNHSVNTIENSFVLWGADEINEKPL